jgi:nucleotide-binding universal stress UspA family protein
MFRKLLVPLDLGDKALAKAAIDKAKGLAKAWDSEIRLVTVLPLVPSTYLEYVPADFQAGERARDEKELNATLAGMELPAGKGSITIRTGGVYHEVLAEAEAWHADLIVLSSHWPTLVTYLVGSHATNIVRHANCSVLVVRT